MRCFHACKTREISFANFSNTPRLASPNRIIHLGVSATASLRRKIIVVDGNTFTRAHERKLSLVTRLKTTKVTYLRMTLFRRHYRVPVVRSNKFIIIVFFFFDVYFEQSSLWKRCVQFKRISRVSLQAFRYAKWQNGFDKSLRALWLTIRKIIFTIYGCYVFGLGEEWIPVTHILVFA